MRFSSSIRTLAAVSILWLSPLPGRAQTAAQFIAKGDANDRIFAASAALKSYLPAEKLEPKNVRLLLSIARQYRHLMADAPAIKEKLNLGGMALTYGLKAAALGPNDSEAQLSPAITYGKMLPFQGKQAQVDTAPLIKEAVDKALRLDPRNDTAWHILGRWHQSLANVGNLKRALGSILYGELPVGTNEKSVTCFNKAIAINPHRLRHYIQLGRTYAQMGAYDKARKQLMRGLSMPNLEKDDPDEKLLGREALALLP
jgi:tetratricopeptide (TPR) repeat protein